MRRARSRATCSRRPLCPGLTPSDFPVRRRVQSGRTDRPWNYSDRRHCGIPSIHHDDSGILAEGAAEEHRERALGPDVHGHLDGIRDGLLDGILARRWPCPGRMRGSGVPEGPGLSTPRSLCGRRRARGGVRRGSYRSLAAFGHGVLPDCGSRCWLMLQLAGSRSREITPGSACLGMGMPALGAVHPPARRATESMPPSSKRAMWM
jgi:hypothetical protein